MRCARTLSFTLRIADDAPAGRAEITTEFLVDAAGFRATRRDALNVGNYNVHTGVSRAQGGRIALSPDAMLEFAAEALAVDAAIETTVWSSDESLEFSFGPEMRFGAPVTLTVQLGERLSAAQREAGVRPVLRYLPPDGAERGTEPEAVPSRYDAEDAGRNIGIDRSTGQPTTYYTVITDVNEELVTAFPGWPTQK